MRINKAISKIMKEKKVTQQSMAVSIGKSKATDVSSRLARGQNMGIENAREMLEVLGYEIVVQPKSGGKRKEGAIVIDRGEE